MVIEPDYAAERFNTSPPVADLNARYQPISEELRRRHAVRNVRNNDVGLIERV